MGSIPLAYLITFSTRGSWLHGDDRGSVDREHNVYGEPLLAPDARRRSIERRRTKHAARRLDTSGRDVVTRTIVEVCAHRQWELVELNVRTNHVHVVVSVPQPPERVMADVKARCTRRLREQRLIAPAERPWTEHASTRYLWTEQDVRAACRYVLDGQGADL